MYRKSKLSADGVHFGALCLRVSSSARARAVLLLVARIQSEAQKPRILELLARPRDALLLGGELDGEHLLLLPHRDVVRGSITGDLWYTNDPLLGASFMRVRSSSGAQAGPIVAVCAPEPREVQRAHEVHVEQLARVLLAQVEQEESEQIVRQNRALTLLEQITSNRRFVAKKDT